MKLIDYLKESGLKQEDFAALVGVTQGRISQLVAGDSPSLPLALRIFDETKGRVGLSDWQTAEAA